MHLFSRLGSYACSCLVLSLIQPIYSVHLPSGVEATDRSESHPSNTKRSLAVFDEVQERLILAINRADDSMVWDAADKGFHYMLYSIPPGKSAEIANVFELTLDSDSSSQDDAPHEEKHKGKEKQQAKVNILAGVNPVSDSSVGCIYLGRLKDGTTGDMLLSAMHIAASASLKSSKQWVVDTLNETAKNGYLDIPDSSFLPTSLDDFDVVQAYADLLYNKMEAGHIEPTKFCSIADLVRGLNGERQVQPANALTLENGIAGQPTFTHLSIAFYNHKKITFEQAKQQMQWGGDVDSVTRADDDDERRWLERWQTFDIALLASSKESPQSQMMIHTETTSEVGVHGVEVRYGVDPTEQESLITIIVLGKLARPMKAQEIVEALLKVQGFDDFEENYGDDDRCSTMICIFLLRLQNNKLLPAIERINVVDLEAVLFDDTMKIFERMDKTELPLEERIWEININHGEESQVDEEKERAELGEKSEEEERADDKDGRDRPKQRLRRSIRVPPQSINTNTSAMSLHSLFGRGINCWGIRKGIDNSLFSKSTTGNTVKGLGAGQIVQLSVEKVSGQSSRYALGGTGRFGISTTPKNSVPQSGAAGMIKYPGPPPVRATQAVSAVAIASSEFSQRRSGLSGTMPGKGQPLRSGVSSPSLRSSRIQINYLFFQDWVARQLHSMKLDHKLKGLRVGGVSLYSIIFRQMRVTSVFVQSLFKFYRAIIQAYSIHTLFMLPFAALGGLVSFIQAITSTAPIEERRMIGAAFIPFVGCVAHKNYLHSVNPAGVNQGMHNAAHGLCLAADALLVSPAWPVGVVLKGIEMIVRAISKVDEFETKNLQIEYEEKWEKIFNKKFDEYQALLQSNSFIERMNVSLQTRVFADVPRFGLVATALYTASGKPVLPQKLADTSSDPSDPVKFIGRYPDFNGSIALNLAICHQYRKAKESLVLANLEEIKASINEMRLKSLAEFKKQKVDLILKSKLDEAEKQSPNMNHQKPSQMIEREKQEIREEIRKASEKGFAGVIVAKDIWSSRDFFKRDIERRIRNSITYIPDSCKPTCDHILDMKMHMCFYDDCQGINTGLTQLQLRKLGYSQVPQTLLSGQDTGLGGCQVAGYEYCGKMAPHTVPFPPYRYGPKLYCLKVIDNVLDMERKSNISDADIDLPDQTNSELVLRRWFSNPVYAPNGQEATDSSTKLYEFHDTNVTVEILKSEQQHERVRRSTWRKHFQAYMDGAKKGIAVLELTNLRDLVGHLSNETETQQIWLRRENYLTEMLWLKDAEVVNDDDGTMPRILCDESKLNLLSQKSSEWKTKTKPLQKKLELRLDRLTDISKTIEKNANDQSALTSIMDSIIEEWPSSNDWPLEDKTEETVDSS